MKQLLSLFLVFTVSILSAQSVQSPSGKIVVNFKLVGDGQPTYSVNYKDKAVVLESALGIKLKEKPVLDAKFEISYVHENDYLISFTKNISAEGMFVETESPPAVGSIIKLIFSIGNLKKMEIDAEVIWVNKGPLSKDHGMGLKFLDMPASDKEALLKEINIVAVLCK